MVKTNVCVLMVTGRIQKPKEAAYQPCESYEILIFDAMKKPAELTKNEVIELIVLMNKLNNREYAKMVYHRENARCPEWDLEAAFLARKALETK